MAQWLRALARVQHTHRMVCYSLQPSSTPQRQLRSCDIQHTRTHTWKYEIKKENDDKFKLNHVNVTKVRVHIIYLYLHLHLYKRRAGGPPKLSRQRGGSRNVLRAISSLRSAFLIERYLKKMTQGCQA